MKDIPNREFLEAGAVAHARGVGREDAPTGILAEQLHAWLHGWDNVAVDCCQPDGASKTKV